MITRDGVTLRDPALEHIQLAVANHFGVHAERLLSPERTKWLSTVRMLAMTIAGDTTGYSLGEIGAAFGGRHHTTVLHARNQIERLRKIDKRIALAYDEIVKLLAVPESP